MLLCAQNAKYPRVCQTMSMASSGMGVTPAPDGGIVIV